MGQRTHDRAGAFLRTQHSSTLRRHAVDCERNADGEVAWRRGDPIIERLPNALCLPLIQPLERHGDIKGVILAEGGAFAPMRIQQAVSIEADESVDESAESGIRASFYLHSCSAGKWPAAHVF